MANIFGQIDNKILSMKIDQALEMLRTKSPEELKGKVSKVDRNELMRKLSELDAKKIKEMNTEGKNKTLDLTKKEVNVKS